MKDKKSFQEWFWNYTANNWVLTPKSKRVLFAAGGILAAALFAAVQINKKK
jgi:hypothetical protein